MSGNPNGEAGKATGIAAPGDRRHPIPTSAQHPVPSLELIYSLKRSEWEPVRTKCNSSPSVR